MSPTSCRRPAPLLQLLFNVLAAGCFSGVVAASSWGWGGPNKGIQHIFSPSGLDPRFCDLFFPVSGLIPAAPMLGAVVICSLLAVLPGVLAGLAQDLELFNAIFPLRILSSGVFTASSVRCAGLPRAHCLGRPDLRLHTAVHPFMVGGLFGDLVRGCLFLLFRNGGEGVVAVMQAQSIQLRCIMMRHFEVSSQLQIFKNVDSFVGSRFRTSF